MLDKKLLREQMKQTLNTLTKQQYEQQSLMIAQSLFEDDRWAKAEVIGMTISNPPEVDTFQLIRKAWEQNKRVVVPKCHPKDRSMVFREIKSFLQLEVVYSKLLEPIESETKELKPNEIDLLIVPGLAFSRTGYRLGFGGGYYDRYLGQYNGPTISLAFHQQIVPELPIDPFDLPIEKIISDKEVIIING